MSKKIITHNNGVVETRETFYTEETIQQLRHQLEQAQTRISELEDKDWYEANIKQLEEQNDRLIQERDSLKQHLSIKIEELHIAYCGIENVKTKNGELKAENKTLKEFADKLDEEFGKNVEPTLGEKADNIIALYRTNKKYCEIADEKIKDLQSQLDQANERLKSAIVLKFKVGQEVYKVYTREQLFPFKVKVVGFKGTLINNINSVLYAIKENGFEIGWYPEEILFATLKEATNRLRKLKEN